MKSRRQARQVVLQVLYSCDTLGDYSSENIEFILSTAFSGVDEDSDSSENENQAFVRVLLESVVKNLADIDGRIALSSKHWTVARMARVDRNILRIATAELLYSEEIPVKVAINEAVELAKTFSSDDSPTFINGVLDHIASNCPKSSELAMKVAVND